MVRDVAEIAARSSAVPHETARLPLARFDDDTGLTLIPWGQRADVDLFELYDTAVRAVRRLLKPWARSTTSQTVR